MHENRTKWLHILSILTVILWCGQKKQNVFHPNIRRVQCIISSPSPHWNWSTCEQWSVRSCNVTWWFSYSFVGVLSHVLRCLLYECLLFCLKVKVNRSLSTNPFSSRLPKARLGLDQYSTESYPHTGICSKNTAV